jgi:hypothetical protein
MNRNDSLQAPDTSNRETVGAEAPLPLSHLTMTDRFRFYDAAIDGRVLPSAVDEWALMVVHQWQVCRAPRVPSFNE